MGYVCITIYVSKYLYFDHINTTWSSKLFLLSSLSIQNSKLCYVACDTRPLSFRPQGVSVTPRCGAALLEQEPCWGHREARGHREVREQEARRRARLRRQRIRRERLQDPSFVSSRARGAHLKKGWKSSRIHHISSMVVQIRFFLYSV